MFVFLNTKDKEDIMKKKLFIGVWHPSVVLTYIGALFSITGICVFEKDPGLSIVLLICAAVCDMFDGVVARSFERTDMEKNFGVQLDSLADICSFVVFPAYALIHLCNHSLFSYIIGSVYAVAGIARLAWFNITTDEAPDHFTGLPVTCVALLIPFAYVILSLLDISKLCQQVIWCILYMITAVLFIGNFKLNKPGVKCRVLVLPAAIALITVLLFVI